MNIDDLKTFLVLANTKSFTRASEQLYIAQSTVTNRISELERELNFRLFMRNNRMVELTGEGEQFREYAEKILAITGNMLSDIAATKKYKNYLRIGCSDSIYEGHLASALLEHRKKHPEDSLKITIGLSEHLIDQMRDNIFDVVFTYLQLQGSQYHCEVYKQDEIVLVTDYNNNKYPRGITRDELIGENYLMCNYALQNVGQFIRDIFPKYHRFALEIDDCAKVIPYIVGSQSYTFLPADTALMYLKNKTLRKVKLKDLEPPVISSYMVCKKSKRALCEKIFGIGD